MISDENLYPTFWMQPRPESSTGAGHERLPFNPKTARFVDTRQTESNTFVYNNLDWMHGASKHPTYSKILCSLSIKWDHRNNKFFNLLDKKIPLGCKPIKTDLEKTDSSGNLVNESGARTGAIIGSFLDPVQAISTRASYDGGWTDITGKGYTAQLEKEAKDRISAEKAYNDQVAAQEKQKQDQINMQIQSGIDSGIKIFCSVIIILAILFFCSVIIKLLLIVSYTFII